MSVYPQKGSVAKIENIHTNDLNMSLGHLRLHRQLEKNMALKFHKVQKQIKLIYDTTSQCSVFLYHYMVAFIKIV